MTNKYNIGKNQRCMIGISMNAFGKRIKTGFRVL